MSKVKAIISDLDGTLCNLSHRLHFIENENNDKDWHQFHSNCLNDTIFSWCENLLRSMQKSGYKIIFMTGRDDAYIEQTKIWLKKHDIAYEMLLMRKAGDNRPDSVVKWELYQNNLSHYDIEFVLEDRNSVVEMWREKGIRCLQCAPGDF